MVNTIKKKLTTSIKRVGAVALTALAVSSAFGAGLTNYESNFAKDGKFTGQIVIGDNSDDASSVTQLINDLEKKFNVEEGDTKTKITYRKIGSGDSEDVIKSNSELNYGETLGSVSEDLDEDSLDILADDRFDNGLSDEDYTQNLKFENGQFNYALRDNVDDIDEISNNLYYEDGDVFARYTLELDNSIDLSQSSDLDEDFVGQTLKIMGNEFTITEISRSGSDLESLTLIGGNNEVALNEGDSTNVDVDGKEYNIEVISVSYNKVLLDVDGKTKTIDLYDSEEVNGLNIAVTDLINSERDSIKGYATLVVGGNKIKLDNNKEVQVNDEDVSDLFDEKYEIVSKFGSEFSTIEIEYKVNDDTLLEEGDYLEDVLFNAFKLKFNGINDVEYKTVEISADDEDVSIKGELASGDEFNEDFIHTTSTTGANGVTYVRGENDEDVIFYKGMSYDGSLTLPNGITTDYVAASVKADATLDTMTFTADTAGAGGNDLSVEIVKGADINATTTGGTYTTKATVETTKVGDKLVITFHNVVDDGAGNDDTVTITRQNIVDVVNNNVGGFGALNIVATITDDLSSDVDAANGSGTAASGVSETDLTGGLTANLITKFTFDLAEDDYEGSGFFVYDDEVNQYLYRFNNIDTIDKTADIDEILQGKDKTDLESDEFENDLEVDLSSTTDDGQNVTISLNDLGDAKMIFDNELLMDFTDINSNGISGDLTFSLDDVKGDANTDEDESYDLTFTWDSSDGIKLSIDDNDVDFVNKAYAEDEDGSDYKTFVTSYGTKVRVNTVDDDSVKIMTPDEQVSADVELIIGDENSDEMTVTVDSDDVSDKKAELIDKGYEIVSMEDVEVDESYSIDIKGATFASDVDEIENMIVIGGPAINKVAAELMDMEYPTYGAETGVEDGEYEVKYFKDKNVVLVYGYTKDDTLEGIKDLIDNKVE